VLGNKATEKYLQILSVAIRTKSDAGERILSFPCNGTRIEFARTRDEIEKSGKDTNPQKIPKTDFWALTNTRTEVKRDVLRRLLLHVGYSKDVAREASETL
jgi:negative regulator of replication initiation